MDGLPHDEESQAGNHDRAEDADDGLHQWGTMEAEPLLDGEVFLHGVVTS
jgi:hypothetical protein